MLGRRNLYINIILLQFKIVILITTRYVTWLQTVVIHVPLHFDEAIVPTKNYIIMILKINNII